jgi:hypothetical protein
MDTKTYLKTTGTAKTYIQTNSTRDANEINWNLDYDGKTADIDVDVERNGKIKHYTTSLGNEDLANILQIPSVKSPLEERLRNDFLIDNRVYKLKPINNPYLIDPLIIKKSKRRSKKKITTKSSKKTSSKNSGPKTMRIQFNKKSNKKSNKSTSRRSSKSSKSSKSRRSSN